MTKPKEYKDILELMVKTPSMAQDDQYTRLQYVRYADDFIIGVEGSHAQAKKVLEEITRFVENELQLSFNPDKTGITDYSVKPVKFLGYSIAAPHLNGAIKPIENIKLKGEVITRRKKVRIKIHMDKEKVLSRLIDKKIVNKRVSHQDHQALQYRGRFLGNMINMDHADIIRYYNSVIRGLHNYYDFVDNRSDLLHVV